MRPFSCPTPPRSFALISPCFCTEFVACASDDTWNPRGTFLWFVSAVDMGVVGVRVLLRFEPRQHESQHGRLEANWLRHCVSYGGVGDVR